MKGKGWIIFQIIQFLIFSAVSVFIFVRTVDGHGAEQTPYSRWISFAVWALFYAGLLVVEWMIFFFVRRSKK